MRIEFQSSAVVYSDDGTVLGHCVTWNELESVPSPMYFSVQLSKVLEGLSNQTFDKVVDIVFPRGTPKEEPL